MREKVAEGRMRGMPLALTRFHQQMIMRFFQNDFQRVEHIIIPESDNPYSSGCKYFCPFFVIKTLLFVCMASTIKLNSKSGIMTVEVENISTNRVLPSKFKTAETATPQEIPDQVFGICLLLAKLSGKYQQLLRYWQRCPLTLTLSLMEREQIWQR